MRVWACTCLNLILTRVREEGLRREPGNIENSESKREHGKLVYSFDIRKAKGTTGVQVKAAAKKIVHVKHENKKQEAAEEKRGSARKRPAGVPSNHQGD